MLKRTVISAVLAALVAGCSGSSTETASCQEMLSTSQFVATQCGDALPPEACLTACNLNLSQCNANDQALLQAATNCLQSLSNCDSETISLCEAGEPQLSAGCVAATQVVTACYPRH